MSTRIRLRQRFRPRISEKTGQFQVPLTFSKNVPIFFYFVAPNFSRNWFKVVFVCSPALPFPKINKAKFIFFTARPNWSHFFPSKTENKGIVAAISYPIVPICCEDFKIIALKKGRLRTYDCLSH